MIDQGKMLKNLARAAKRSGGSRGGSDPGAAFRESFVEDRRRRRQAAEKLRRRREKEAVEFEGMSSELKRLAESGFAGPSQARAVYDRLMASDISEGQKRRLAEVMEGGRSHEDADANRGFLGKLKDVASAPVAGGLKALATVGRVVPALVDEGLEALYDYDKEGMDTSFLDKVWRDDDYGVGKAFQRSVDFEKARGGDGKLFGLVDADNEALKRGVGFVGDVALDPLTWTTLGAGTAMSAGGKAARAGAAAARVSRRADALKAAGKAGKAAELAGDASEAARVLEKAGRFGSRRGPQLSKFQVGHRFAEHSKIAHDAARKAEKAGDAAEAAKHLAKAKEFEDAAAAVARRGAGGVSGAMLDEVGLQGGLNFMGRQLLSHDTVRPLTSKFGAAAGAGSRKLSPVLRNLGSDELKDLRRVYREGVVKGADGKLAKASGRDIADAMLTRTAKQMGGTPASRRLMATAVQPLEKLFKEEVDRRGISGEKLYHAITGNVKAAQEIELAAPGLLQRVRDGVAEVRRGVNEISGGADVIADRGESYLQGLVSDEYREFAQKMGWWDGQVSPTAKKGGKYRKSNEMRAHRAGDEFMGQQLGSPELHARFSPDYEPGSVGAIQRQMEGLAHDNGLPSSVKMFEEDAFASVRSMVRSASVRAQELGTARHLMELGVASPMRGADVGEALGGLGAKRSKVATQIGEAVGHDVTDLTGQRLAKTVTDRMASATPAARERVAGLVRQKVALDTEFATLSATASIVADGPEGMRATAESIRRFLSSDGAAAMGERFESAAPFLKRQADKLEAAASVSDPALQRVAVQDAMADGLEASLALSGKPPESVDAFLGKLRGSQGELSAMLEDGFTAMGDLGLRHHELPDWVYETIERTVDFSREPNKLLQQIDKVNTHFKAFALTSVGFHVRNFFGGVFNNALDGVEMGAYRSARRVNRAWSTGDVSKLSPYERLFLREVEQSGMLYDELKAGFEIPDSMRTRQMILEGDPNVAGRKKDRFMERQAVKVEGVRSEASRGRRAAADAVRAFGLTDNALTRANTEAGNYVERQLRLANYISNRSRGMTPDESMFKVYQFHFDYSDLSTAEMGWGRRLIPFWTWTSRNLPLQLEMMVKNPKMYNRFNHVKRALEGDEDGRAAFHPSWLTNNPSNINVSSVPFVGDKVDYFRPDLPFGDIDQQVQAISTHGFAGLTESASPVFRVPMELAFGVQSFNNAPISDKAEPIPSSWSWLSPALEALPSSFRRPDGRLMISGETRYVIEQFQPALARIKGLFPGDNEKDQARRTDRLLSFMGLGTTRVTDQMKSNEFYRVKDEFEALEDRAVKQGRAQSPEQRRAMKALEKLEKQAAKDRKKERDERLKRIQKVGGR